MLEIRDRSYFFVSARDSLGALVAYRSDGEDVAIGTDVCDLFDLGARERELISFPLRMGMPFMAVVEHYRGSERRAAIFMRPFYGQGSLYVAVEPDCPFSVTCAALSALPYDGILMSEGVLREIRGASDAAFDPHICSLLQSIYQMYASFGTDESTYHDVSAVSQAVGALCDIIGVGLELKLFYDDEPADISCDRTFSWRRFIELFAVIAAVARRYTVKRRVGVEIYTRGRSYRVKCLLDYYSSEDEAMGEGIIDSYCTLCDNALTAYRDGARVYEFVPNERELEVVGVKQDD